MPGRLHTGLNPLVTDQKRPNAVTVGAVCCEWAGRCGCSLTDEDVDVDVRGVALYDLDGSRATGRSFSKCWATTAKTLLKGSVLKLNDRPLNPHWI
jgi:hypothetical protein